MNGLGVGSISLDWMTVTSFLGSPLVLPSFAIFNRLIGFIAVAYIIIPFSYWSNAFEARKFPLFSTNIYDSQGHKYNVSRILDSNTTVTFNQEAYDNYSKIYFTTSLIYSYAFILAQYTSSISQITLFYGRSLWQKFKRAYKDDDELDVHGRLMKQNYKSIPQWWFYSILLSMIGMAILVCEGFGGQIQLRYWEVLLACALVFLFLPLECVLEAIAGSGFTLDLLLEAIIGYLNPGKPLANMAFKLYGSEAYLLAVYTISNFKLSHYMKIPPKILFHLMILGTTISCFTDFGIAWWMLRSIDNICQPDLLPEGSPWTCPTEKAMYISGVTWGLVGPSKMFYPDGIYSVVFIFALIGLVAPIPIWLLSHKYPEKKWIGLINFPIIFSAAHILPYGGIVGYWSWFIVGLLFNYFIYHKHREWWTRYNYLLSAGLTAGSAFFILLLSVSLQFQNIYGVNWWGLELGDHCSLANCPTMPGVIIEGCPIIQ
ncbi:oligopeptide transporter 5-like [Zingiber officinale]|uniref:oligopeptide transporter 5-like n=1 Tax=Zingiber officinale TaxID=94328 RepID=UPI001C4D37C0|nr:oligopeptide transporter 5-like [Zingiber officinale]